MGIGQNNPEREWEKKIKEQIRPSKFRQHDQGSKAGRKKKKWGHVHPDYIILKNEDEGHWAVWTTELRSKGMEIGLAKWRDWDWKDSLRHGGLFKCDWGRRNGDRNKFKEQGRRGHALVWLQRKINVYQCMTSSKATCNPRMTNPSSFASREGYHEYLESSREQ